MSGLTKDCIKKWRESSNFEEVIHSLRSVNSNLGQKFAFPELDENVRKDVCEFFVTAFPEASANLQCALLELIRILCRDKNGINSLFSEELVELVLKAAGIFPKSKPTDHSVLMEAVKCLVNALFNSVVARTGFENKCCQLMIQRDQEIIKHLKSIQENKESVEDKGKETEYSCFFDYLEGIPKDVLELLLFFDLRICFVASAHSIELQKKWVEDSENTQIFLEVLKFACRKVPIPGSKENDWATESLKILFNLYCHAQMYDFEIAELCAKECSNLVQNPAVDDDLKQNAIHLLATMPSCLSSLCPELTEQQQKEINTTKIYENFDMRFVDSTLELLSRKIDKTGISEVDLLSTFFTTLIHLCKNHKAARRYCRLKVIPPLKAQHVEMPPDQGKTLRNKIVRLLTSPTHCKDLAAEFLFVLCKRNVGRLVKYTGLGHSAGLLANYGFLGAINDPRRANNPLNHMTEEQKEYEAIQLANAMNKLMDEGIFQPASIGPDGKPVAVSHVNELIKNVPSEEENSDSD
ncbi:hypothetical protein FO519_003487 [Halicephalobus sp. NKZ332]|nr:hypothetical protein FO519_003487 [Halicephalobus sp. NKZ332]